MRARTVVAAVLAVALAGCGGEGSRYGGTSPTINPVGSWTIRAYNGVAAPLYFTLQTQFHTLEVTSDVVIVNANGTFVNNYTTKETVGSDVTTESFSDTGTWSKTGPATFSYQFDGFATTYSATLDDDNLITTADGANYVYVRVGS